MSARGRKQAAGSGGAQGGGGRHSAAGSVRGCTAVSETFCRPAWHWVRAVREPWSRARVHVLHPPAGDVPTAPRAQARFLHRRRMMLGCPAAGTGSWREERGIRREFASQGSPRTWESWCQRQGVSPACIRARSEPVVAHVTFGAPPACARTRPTGCSPPHQPQRPQKCCYSALWCELPPLLLAGCAAMAACCISCWWGGEQSAPAGTTCRPPAHTRTPLTAVRRQLCAVYPERARGQRLADRGARGAPRLCSIRARSSVTPPPRAALLQTGARPPSTATRNRHS